MILTIFYSNSKVKQVIHLHDSFAFDSKGQRITYSKMHDKCKDIAFDVTGGNYISFSFETQ